MMSAEFFAGLLLFHVFGGVLVGSFHTIRSGHWIALPMAVLLGPIGWLLAAMLRDSPATEAQHQLRVEAELARLRAATVLTASEPIASRSRGDYDPDDPSGKKAFEKKQREFEEWRQLEAATRSRERESVR